MIPEVSLISRLRNFMLYASLETDPPIRKFKSILVVVMCCAAGYLSPNLTVTRLDYGVVYTQFWSAYLHYPAKHRRLVTFALILSMKCNRHRCWEHGGQPVFPWGGQHGQPCLSGPGE
jgi:hypothetical protein